MFSFLIIALFWCQDPDEPQITEPVKMDAAISRASLNGPSLTDGVFQQEKSGYATFLKFREAIQEKWLPQVYQNARAVDLKVDLDMTIKPPRELGSKTDMEFRVDLEGLALPSGQYRFKVNGELGEMDMYRGPTKKMLVYHTGKGFSDQNLPRSENANLDSYRSYALRYLGELQNQVLQKGGYRFIYVGSGDYQGKLVDRIKIAKDVKKRRAKKKDKKQTVPLNRLWSFWQDGEYELWVYQDTYLPAAVFYANREDHIYANIIVSYHSDLLPSSFLLTNNSTGFEGRADIQLDYAEDRTISRVSFKMRSSDANDMSFDAHLAFKSDFDQRDLQGIPPYGYQKLNPDHLKILILTPIIGNLLNLRQQGLNLKNFKF